MVVGVRGPQADVLELVPPAEDGDLVGLEGDEALVVECLAGKPFGRRSALVGVEGEVAVEALQDAGEPGGVGLEDGHFELGVAIEEAREQHLGQPDRGLVDEAEGLGVEALGHAVVVGRGVDELARRVHLGLAPAVAGAAAGWERVHAEDDARLVERPEHGIPVDAAEGRIDLAGVVPLGVDGTQERDAEVHLFESRQLLHGVFDALNGKPSRGEQTVGNGFAEVGGPVVVGTGEGVGARGILHERKVLHDHRGNDHDLVDPHQVHFFDPGVGFVGALVLQVVPLLIVQRRHEQLSNQGLGHARAGDADGVVRGQEHAALAGENAGLAVQQAALLVAKIRLMHELALLGLDVVPDLQGVVNVGVAVENRKRFTHRLSICRHANLLDSLMA